MRQDSACLCDIDVTRFLLPWQRHTCCLLVQHVSSARDRLNAKTRIHKKSNTKQNKTKRNKAKQNKTKQSKAKRNNINNLHKSKGNETFDKRRD